MNPYLFGSDGHLYGAVGSGWQGQTRASLQIHSGSGCLPRPKVDPPKKLGHCHRNWPLIKLRRRSDLGHGSVKHQSNPVGHQTGFGLMVGHPEGGQPQLGLKLQDQILHLISQMGIQRAQGFIQQQKLRLHHQGPRQGHPLRLPP